MMSFGILATPGLVINGKVKCAGRIPRPEEIKAWIQEAGLISLERGEHS